MCTLAGAILHAMGLAATAVAGGGPENVAVIVNGDSWASRAIANEYAALRQIPPSNIIILDGIPDFESITVEEFRALLLQPVIDAITSRGLDRQIDIVAWSCDFPWAIDIRGDAGDVILPQFATPTASINGLTYLYGPVLAKNVNYVGMGVNYYYRRPDAPINTVQWPLQAQQEYQRALELLQERQNLVDAERVLAQATADHPDAMTLWYNLACVKAVMGKADEAFAALTRAIQAGWNNADHTRGDEDLASLRALPQFQRLLQEMQAERIFAVAPAMGFRHEYGFGPDGGRVEPQQGAHYLLSTMLAVTSGRGLSVQGSLDALARAAAADATHPDGTFYYMRNRDVRSQTRQWGFASAVALLKEMGHAAEILEGELPLGRRDVLGLMAGSPAFDIEQSGITILPGALCEHLTSFGGIMREAGGQTPLTEFIRHGAAGASGTVFEPYSIQAKFPDPFIHVHYAQGCSLAESFYQSVAGPYQLLIVGDPLCAPWANPPRITLDGPRPGEVVRETFDITPRVADDRGIRRIDFFIDGRLVGRFPSADTVHIDTNLLSDGWHELRFVAAADDPIETQGRAILPIQVANHGRSARFTVNRREAGLDHTIEARAEAPGALGIEIMHCGQPIAVIKGERGSAEIPASALGLGRSLLQAHAIFPEDAAPADAGGADIPAQLGPNHIVRSEPVEVAATAGELVRPTGRGALNRELQPGLLLTSESGERAVATETREANWLTVAGMRHDEKIAMEGWLRAEEDGLHQLQIRTPREIALRVDGKAIPLQTTAEWQFVPLQLARGLHELNLTLAGPGPPELAIRFGLRGAQSLDGRRVRYRP